MEIRAIMRACTIKANRAIMEAISIRAIMTIWTIRATKKAREISANRETSQSEISGQSG